MTPEDCLVKGKDAASAKNTDMAVSLFSSILSRRPDNFEAMYLLGGIYMELNQKEKALPLFEKALTFKPPPEIDLPARQTIAQIHYSSGRRDKAEEEFITLLSKYEDDAAISRDIIYLKATTYWQGAEYEKALATFQQLLKISSAEQLPELNLLIALVMRDAGKPDQAKARLKSLLSTSGTPKEIANNARVNLANAAMSEGDFSQAEQMLREAVENSADAGQCNELATRLSAALAAGGKQDHAKELLLYVIGKFPSEKQLNSARIALASIHLAEGKKDDALKQFEIVCKTPANADQGRWACEMVEEISTQIQGAAGKPISP
jgi:tetratricopeptide (TPR) repeat protein